MVAAACTSERLQNPTWSGPPWTRLGAVAFSFLLWSCCPPCDRRFSGSAEPGTSGFEAEACLEADDAREADAADAALTAPAGDPVSVPDDAWSPAIRHVIFTPGSAELDVAAFSELIALAETLRTYPQFELIELQGIAMDRRADADELSRRRVVTVVRWLRHLGVDGSRMQYRVFGDRCDAQATGPEEARQVRIMLIRFDGRDLGNDPFGDCGDPRAATAPVVRADSTGGRDE